MDSFEQVGRHDELTQSHASPTPGNASTALNLSSSRQRYSQFRRSVRIALLYLVLAWLWMLLFDLVLPRFFWPSASLALISIIKNLLLVTASTLWIYFFLSQQEQIDGPALAGGLQPTPTDVKSGMRQELTDRTGELTRLLDVSHDVNVKLEGLLADQAAVAIENTKLHEEAGQVAILEERQRLGRDLHDSVTQALYSMLLFADATQLALAAGKQSEATENLSQVRKMARQAMADMRLLIYQLHPPLLEKEGLAAAIHARLDAVESRAGLRTEFRVEGECELAPALQRELYRIAQEALNNVIKHAKAEHVLVELICADHRCRMTITDDGSGFDVSTAQQSGGMGLRNITERAQQISATLNLESSPNAGTRVSIEVNTKLDKTP